MLSPASSPPASPIMQPSPSPALSLDSSSLSGDDHSSALTSAAPGASLSPSSDGSGLPSRPVAEFLFHLTRMLTDPSIRNLIEWTAEGSIRVHDPHTLENEVLGKYFRHSKYSSFQRQLNYFGFRKVGSKGRMSPCSYINDDTGDDLSTLLSIKRKTANRARSRKAQAEKEATTTDGKGAAAASVSDSDSCSEADEQQLAAEKKAKKEKKEKKDGSKKRKKSSSSSPQEAPANGSPAKKSKKKKRSGSSKSSSPKVTEIKQEDKMPAPLAPAAIAVADIDFGPPGSVDLPVNVSSAPAPTPPGVPLVSPAVLAASVLPSPTQSSSTAPQQPSSMGNSSWEQLLLPQAASMVPAVQPYQPAPQQALSFQPAPQPCAAQQVHVLAPVAAPLPAPVTVPVQAPQPMAALPAPTPFVTKFNTPNPLAHLMAAPTPAPAAPAASQATAALRHLEQQQQQEQTPDIASGFQAPAPAAPVAPVVNRPSYSIVNDMADEEISVEKLLSLEWSGVGPSTSSGSSSARRGSFSDLGTYKFPMLSPSSSLVDLAAIPTLAN